MSDFLISSFTGSGCLLRFERDSDGDLLVRIEYYNEKGEAESASSILVAAGGAVELADWLRNDAAGSPHKET